MSAHSRQDPRSKRPRIGPVTLGNRAIGPGRPVFVIAEAGVNHDGCVGTALRLVDAAVQAGADAVKFQAFRADALVTSSGRPADYQRRSCAPSSQREMLERLELTEADFARIKHHCDECGIEMIATPFDTSAVRMLAELGIVAIKIASTDLVTGPLLEAAAATALPLIVSTGASTREEIGGAIGSSPLRDARDRLILMHCVSCYPTPIEAMNLRAIMTLADTFQVPAGLSDHTLSTGTGGLAIAAGACILEKHFTLDREAAGPDHAMSLDPRQLESYVAGVREAERAMGSGALGMTDIESDVRSAARRSVVASVDIAAGDLLTPEMLALKRPGGGIPAAEIQRLTGRHAAVAIPRDTALTWDSVE